MAELRLRGSDSISGVRSVRIRTVSRRACD